MHDQLRPTAEERAEWDGLDGGAMRRLWAAKVGALGLAVLEEPPGHDYVGPSKELRHADETQCYFTETWISMSRGLYAYCIKNLQLLDLTNYDSVLLYPEVTKEARGIV